jgi:hypothetical protein
MIGGPPVKELKQIILEPTRLSLPVSQAFIPKASSSAVFDT